MKKRYIVLIVVACVVVFVALSALVISPMLINGINGTQFESEIVDYRLTKDEDNKDVIIVGINFKNKGKYTDMPYSYCNVRVFQNGVGLVEAYELPKEYDYNSDNQYIELKGGASHKIEFAYELMDTKTDVEIEIEDYSFFFPKNKTKTFKIAK